MSKVYGRGGQKRKIIFGQKNVFSLFKKFSLVKVVQNEKFLCKKYCQKFDLSKNDKFDTSRHRILLKSTNDSQIDIIW